MTDPVHQARAALSDARRALIDAQERNSLAVLNGGPLEPLDAYQGALTEAETAFAKVRRVGRLQRWLTRLRP
jgi:hypothetical protein